MVGNTELTYNPASKKEQGNESNQSVDNPRVSSNRKGKKNRKIGHCNPKK